MENFLDRKMRGVEYFVLIMQNSIYYILLMRSSVVYVFPYLGLRQRTRLILVIKYLK